jgi:hypothetical protein
MECLRATSVAAGRIRPPRSCARARFSSCRRLVCGRQPVEYFGT